MAPAGLLDSMLAGPKCLTLLGWVNTLDTPAYCFLASEGRVWDTGGVPLRLVGDEVPLVFTLRGGVHTQTTIHFWFLKLWVSRSLGHTGTTKCGRCMQYTLGLLSRFFLILDLGQDSMAVFNSSEECVWNTCLMGPEAVGLGLPPVSLSAFLMEGGDVKIKQDFFSCLFFHCLIWNS